MKNIITPVCILLFTALFFSCGKKPPGPTQVAFEMSDTMMSKCEFSKVAPKEVFSELKLFGKIAADNNKTAHIYPIVGGNVEKIYVELGDYVKQNQLLATVRSSEVATFQREKLDAQSDVALAEKNLQVAKDLFAGKLNSEKDVTVAEKELTKAKAELARINEVYSIYSLGSSSEYRITAPMSGFIVNKNINQNEVLRSDNADILFSIAEINEVWVLANVNETDISKVAEGYDADIKTISYPDRTYHGKVDKIFNAIDPETKAMKIRVRIPNDDLSLKPEMSATITLHFSEHKNMLAVPSSALIFDKNKTWVVVFRSRTDIEVRRVDVYSELNGFAYISNGLKENEQVISKNALYIYDALTD